MSQASLKKAALLAVTAAVAAGLAGAKEAGYSVVDKFGGPDGGYDYISVDSAKQRVFVGRSDGVMTIDLATRKVTPVFVKADDVAAVLIITGTDLMLSTNGGSNNATLFDRNTGKVKAVIPTGEEPDGALYDERTGLAFVMNSGMKRTSRSSTSRRPRRSPRFPCTARPKPPPSTARVGCT